MDIYEKQIMALADPDWLKNNLNNEWVTIYHEVIEKLNRVNGRIIRPYNQIKISNYYKNFRTPYGWKYCRHHIDEIKISGAIFSQELKELYEIAPTILITIEEHLFLHYIIILAETTEPNNGMLVGLQKLPNAIDEWDKVVKKMCQDFNIQYDASWIKKLSRIPKSF